MYLRSHDAAFARAWSIGTSAAAIARLALVPFIAATVSFAGFSASASAEVRSNTNFMPPSWSSPESATGASSSPQSAARQAVVDDDDDATANRRVRTRSRSARHRTRGVRVASLGALPSTAYAPRRSLSGRGIAWRKSSRCLAGNLRAAVAAVAANYGRVTVNSTCRSKRHNRRVGGARRSYHLTGNAVDFRLHGNVRAAYAYLRRNVGGIKHYGGGRFHIDNGPRRSF